MTTKEQSNIAAKEQQNISTTNALDFNIVAKFMRLKECPTMRALKSHVVNATPRPTAADAYGINQTTLWRSIQSYERTLQLLRDLRALPEPFGPEHYRIMCKLMRLSDTQTTKAVKQVLIDSISCTDASRIYNTSRSGIHRQALSMRKAFAFATMNSSIQH